jgi:hypothetical protein
MAEAKNTSSLNGTNTSSNEINNIFHSHIGDQERQNWKWQVYHCLKLGRLLLKLWSCSFSGVAGVTDCEALRWSTLSDGDEKFLIFSWLLSWWWMKLSCVVAVFDTFLVQEMAAVARRIIETSLSMVSGVFGCIHAFPISNDCSVLRVGTLFACLAFVLLYIATSILPSLLVAEPILFEILFFEREYCKPDNFFSALRWEHLQLYLMWFFAAYFLYSRLGSYIPIYVHLLLVVANIFQLDS